MKSIPLFLAGFAPGAALGMLAALNLSRAVARVAASAPGIRPSTGLARRIALTVAALWLGSRFGAVGLMGAFAGVMAGFAGGVAREAAPARTAPGRGAVSRG